MQSTWMRNRIKYGIADGEILYIGNQPEPQDRRVIRVSQSDDEKCARGGALFSGGESTVEVTDLITMHKLTLRRASCGLPNCNCALEIVTEVPA